MLVKKTHHTIFRVNHRRHIINNYAHKLIKFHTKNSEDYRVMLELYLIPLSGFALNGVLQVLQTLQHQMSRHMQIHSQSWGYVCWLIKSQWIVNTLTEYITKMGFKIFWNMCYLPLYCHLVQTDGFKIFLCSVCMCTTMLLWCEFFTKSPMTLLPHFNGLY